MNANENMPALISAQIEEIQLSRMLISLELLRDDLEKRHEAVIARLRYLSEQHPELQEIISQKIELVQEHDPLVLCDRTIDELQGLLK